MATLNGIDVSAYQPSTICADVNLDFAMVKVTQGVNYTSSVWKQQADDCLNNNKRLGIYHFADAGSNSAQSEADYFFSVAGDYLSKGMVILDYEGDALQSGGSWAKSFMDLLDAEIDGTPAFYASTGNVTGSDYKPIADAGYTFWGANYVAHSYSGSGYDSPSQSSLPQTWWDEVSIWQYTSSGVLSGYSAGNGYSGLLDLDIFYGSTDDWDTLVGVKTSGGGGTNPPSGGSSDYTYAMKKGSSLLLYKKDGSVDVGKATSSTRWIV